MIENSPNLKRFKFKSDKMVNIWATLKSLITISSFNYY